MAKVEDKLFDHDYDGIREYDNPLPPWWVNLFFITIVWSVVYVLYYHVFEIGDRSFDEFKKEYDQTWIKEKDPGYVHAEILPGYRNPYYSNRPEITPKSMLSGVVLKPKEEEKEIVYDFTALTDQPALQKGHEVWVKNCVVCHGQKGEGGIGPNLTDDYWIHGNGINNIMKTIIKGVPEKGMLAWGKILKQEEMLHVGSYVMTLHGTNPPNAKAPQGTLAK